MSFTLRENITAVIETCFSETKDEIQEVAINKILELIRNDKADRKTEPLDEDINVRSKEPQTCSFSDCDNFKNPDYERCIECKRKQIKLKTEQTKRSEDADTPQTEMDKCYKCKWWNYSYGCSNKKGICDFEQADTPQTNLVEDSPSLVKDLVKAFGEDGTWLERQGVYTLTLAEAKQRAVDIIESVLAKDEPTTQTETENSNLTFEKVMGEIQTQVIEFPDTHQKFTFARKIEMDGDSIKIGGWEYKGVKDAERFVKGSEQAERSE